VTELPGSEFSVQRLEDRMRELEAENARLKALVGELLVANQVLREGLGETVSSSPRS